MDPLTIATGCASLVGSIVRVSLTVNSFVRTCRDARSDLDSVSHELSSLKTVLELLSDDINQSDGLAQGISAELETRIKDIIKNCEDVVQDIDTLFGKLQGKQKTKIGVVWAVNGKGDMEKLRERLGAYKQALELALEYSSLIVLRDMNRDVHGVKGDTTQILAGIERLQALLPEDARQPQSSSYMLQRFLDEMTVCAEPVIDDEEGITYERRDSESSQEALDSIVAKESDKKGQTKVDSSSTPHSNSSPLTAVLKVASKPIDKPEKHWNPFTGRRNPKPKSAADQAYNILMRNRHFSGDEDGPLKIRVRLTILRAYIDASRVDISYRYIVILVDNTRVHQTRDREISALGHGHESVDVLLHRDSQIGLLVFCRDQSYNKPSPTLEASCSVTAHDVIGEKRGFKTKVDLNLHCSTKKRWRKREEVVVGSVHLDLSHIDEI